MAVALSHSLRSSLQLLLLLLPLYATAPTHSNVSLGSNLKAENGDSWASPSGEFAFGFWQIQNQGFLLAIWLNKIPEKTIVWSANRGKLVQRGSQVQLTTDGQLILNDPEGKQVWSPDLADDSTGSVAYAAMLDTGNFILATQSNVNLWESFDNPTDTLLPTQRMKQGGRLTARFSETNYTNGKFQLTLDNTGKMALYTTNFPTNSVNKEYWSANTNDSSFQMIFNRSGNIYLAASNGSILEPIWSSEPATEDSYQRAILEYDGVFRLYVHPKSGGSSTNSTSTTWTLPKFIPSDICTSIEQDTGGGVCGFNSYCSLDDEQRPKCDCPPGYVLLDPTNKMGGCKQNFEPQSCDVESNEIDSFELKMMYRTNWPRSDYEHFPSMGMEWCRQACMGDCFCAVAILSDTGDCWKKKIPLSNGVLSEGVAGTALIKVRKSNSTQHNPGTRSPKKDQSTLILVGSVLFGSSMLANMLLLLGSGQLIFKLKGRKKKITPTGSDILGRNLQSYAYNDMVIATNSFKEELGKGAYAYVYKGTLANRTGNYVAVKKLNSMVSESEREFIAEVSAISRTNHKNLVQLLGFCNEGQHRLLVYEFICNGSLATFLFGNPRPIWNQRVHIALGTARGLLYLHEECSAQIIHCDVKPQNILLDESFTPKICDFGMAKLLKINQTQTMTCIRGTKGYVAPEWFKSMPVTVKVDVYSFGIVLLELIFCRKNVEPEAADEKQMILADWAYDCYRNGELQLLVGSDEEAMADIKRLTKFVKIAIWCIQDHPSLRPTMRKAIQMLEGAVEVPPPPDPSSFTSSTRSHGRV